MFGRSSFFALWVLVFTLAAGHGRAQWGAASSLFSQDGVEVALDARVFSVFTMLNALGYDVDTERGPGPLYLPQFSEARTEARARIGRPGPAIDQFRAVVKQHPVDPSAYAKAALELSPAPRFEPAEDASELAQALSGPLRDWYNEEGGVAIFRNVGKLTTPKQKRLLVPIEGLCRKMSGLVRMGSEEDQLLDDTGPEGRVVLVLNELDAHDTLSRDDDGSVTYFIAGPRRDANGDAVLARATALAFGRTLVSREVQKVAKPGTMADLMQTLPEATRQRFRAPADFLTELLSCALLRQVDPSSTCEGSWLADDERTQSALAVLQGRLKSYAEETSLFSEALPGLIATEVAASDPKAPTGNTPSKKP